MRKIILIAILSVFALATSNSVSAWDIETQTWTYVWIDKDKRIACYGFAGGVCTSKVDVTDRFDTTDTSAGSIYIIKEK